MKMSTWPFAVVLSIGLSVWAADPPPAPTWNHNPAASNGPGNWGAVTGSYATCGTQTGGAVGAKQTPIDIQTTKVVEAVLPQLVFRYRDTPFDIENTGHVIEVPYEPGSVLRAGRSVTDEYSVVQFHVHVPSEHTINGKQYDGELHIVHVNRLGENAVVGMMLQKSDQGLGKLDDLAAHAPGTVMAHHLAGVHINARDLLPEDHDYYTYTGSLTTPPCTEGIRWFLLSKPVPISDFALRQLHALIGQMPGYAGFMNNNRPVVPLNNRTVLHSH